MNKNKGNSLPLGWAWTTLGDIAFINPRWWDFNLEDNDTLSFVPMAAVKERVGHLDSTQTRIWKEVKKGFTRFQEDDVIFAKITPSMENGKIAIAGNLFQGRGAGTTELHVLRPTSATNSKFLLYFLLRRSFRSEARASMKGAAGQLRVPSEFLQQTKLPLPPFAEQQEIVDEIERRFSKLDKIIEALKQIRANLHKLRAATLNYACEGKLLPTEAELARRERRTYISADQSLRARLNERRSEWEADQISKIKKRGKPTNDHVWKAKYPEPIKPNTKELPGLAEGWTWATIHQLASSDENSITDGPFGSNLKTEHYTKRGPRLIRLQNIGDGVFNDVFAHISAERFEVLKKHRVFEGDLVIAALGEVLPRACIIPSPVGNAIVKADCIRFKPSSDVASAKYLNFALNSELTRTRTARKIHGVGRPRLNLTEIKSIPLPLPPVAEQERIAAEVERRLSLIEGLDGIVKKNLQRTGDLKERILQDAFEGKLVKQSANHQNALTLLEKAKVERQLREVQLTKNRKGKPRTMKQKTSDRRKITDLLRELKQPLTPEQLFRMAGFKPEEVEEFYAELKEADNNGTVTENKTEKGEVYLAANI